MLKMEKEIFTINVVHGINFEIVEIIKDKNIFLPNIEDILSCILIF